ncbi:hypothetical protein Y032_0256g362 [Ancylostoma ceylanicum]|nr:hypothetical protein Y032_0256g362 [Ancylostoma ceylanicum]
MEHLWTTLISYRPLLLPNIGILRASSSVDIAHARLSISIFQPLIADGGALETAEQGPSVVLLWKYSLVTGCSTALLSGDPSRPTSRFSHIFLKLKPANRWLPRIEMKEITHWSVLRFNAARPDTAPSCSTVCSSQTGQ